MNNDSTKENTHAQTNTTHPPPHSTESQIQTYTTPIQSKMGHDESRPTKHTLANTNTIRNTHARLDTHTQYRCDPLPGFLLTFPCSHIVHHLSDPGSFFEHTTQDHGRLKVHISKHSLGIRDEPNTHTNDTRNDTRTTHRHTNHTHFNHTQERQNTQTQKHNMTHKHNQKQTHRQHRQTVSGTVCDGCEQLH